MPIRIWGCTQPVRTTEPLTVLHHGLWMRYIPLQHRPDAVGIEPTLTKFWRLADFQLSYTPKFQ